MNRAIIKLQSQKFVRKWAAAATFFLSRIIYQLNVLSNFCEEEPITRLYSGFWKNRRRSSLKNLNQKIDPFVSFFNDRRPGAVFKHNVFYNAQDL